MRPVSAGTVNRTSAPNSTSSGLRPPGWASTPQSCATKGDEDTSSAPPGGQCQDEYPEPLLAALDAQLETGRAELSPSGSAGFNCSPHSNALSPSSQIYLESMETLRKAYAPAYMRMLNDVEVMRNTT